MYQHFMHKYNPNIITNISPVSPSIPDKITAALNQSVAALQTSGPSQ